MTLGIIADTHGLLRPGVAEAFAGVDRIVHAGDVGSPAILEALRAIAPTVTVRGNIDVAPWCSVLPETAVVRAGSIELFVIHNIGELRIDPAAAGYRAVIYGHSHRASIEERGGVLYLNPGSAGPQRFKLQPSLARVVVRGSDVEASLIAL